jgi:hypothetical protein
MGDGLMAEGSTHGRLRGTQAELSSFKFQLYRLALVGLSAGWSADHRDHPVAPPLSVGVAR